MPEGPSIIILKELAEPFTGKKVTQVSGNTKTDKDRALGQRIIAFKSWGKHFLICFKDFTIRIHFLMFGSYRINEEKETPPRLSLKLGKDVLNFYSCSVKLIEGPLDEVYDWTADIMSDTWDAAAAERKLRSLPDTFACDAILNQDIFAGAGNIIKNEVLFRIRVHPLSTLGAMPTKQLLSMVKETRKYAFEFLEWKRKFELKKHWKAHNKKECPRCHIPFHREYLGKTHRRSFFCTNCQVLYA